MIKIMKLSGYCFDVNLNIWGDFQICISVPLNSTLEKELKNNGLFNISLETMTSFFSNFFITSS